MFSRLCFTYQINDPKYSKLKKIVSIKILPIPLAKQSEKSVATAKEEHDNLLFPEFNALSRSK